MKDSETIQCGMTEERLARFVEHALPEQDEISVAEHLAGCPKCAELAQQMRALNWLWAGLGAQASVEAVTVVSAALTSAAEKEVQPELRERFRLWSERWHQAAPRIIRDLARTAAAPVAELGSNVEEALQTWGWMWSLRLEPLPISRVRGDQHGPSRKTRSMPGVPPARSWPTVTVQWRSENSIEVQVTGLPSKARQPMVVLVPLRRGLHRLRGELRQERGKWRAVFENVEAGAFALALEPLQTR
jgi:uncharacterized protein YukE